MQMCYFSFVYKSVGNFENIINKSRGTLSKDELTVKRGGGLEV